MAEKKQQKSKATSAAKKPTPSKKTTEVMPEDIWERIPGENAEQYKKFCAYRDMAYEGDRPTNKRSLQKLSVQLKLKDRKPLELLSRKFDWVKRCTAYDDYTERLARSEQEAAIIEMRRRQARLGKLMVEKAESLLECLTDEKLSASDIARLADVGVKIERLSRGESTENQKVKGEVTHAGNVKVESQIKPDVTALTDGELNQLEKLLDKLH